MRRPLARAFWVSAFGALGIFDLWCAKNAVEGDSLSEVTRTVFCTRTPLGRAAFIGFWSAVTAVVIPHICRNLKET